MKKRILLDFDGVLRDDSKDEKPETATGKPMPGAIEALELLHDAGYDLAVFTARRDLVVVRNWLTANVFDAIERFELPVTNMKTPSDLYVDDQAVHFLDWESTLDEIENRTASPDEDDEDGFWDGHEEAAMGGEDE